METNINSSTLESISTQLRPFSFHPESLSQRVETGSQTHESGSTPLSLTPPPSSPEAPCLDLPGKTPDRDVSPLSLSSMLVNQPVSTPTVTSIIVPSTTYPSVVEHTNFKQIAIHTAKCDKCNNHNKETLSRCTTCGFQICTPCWLHRGGGNHAVTRVFRGPVFDPIAVNEEGEVDDEKDGFENPDVSMSDACDDVEDNESDAIIVSDNEGEQAIFIDNSENVSSIHSINEHSAPPSPPPPSSQSSSLDILHRDLQIGEASQPMFICSSDPENSGSDDDDSVQVLPAYQTICARTIARRCSREPFLNHTANGTNGDESVVEMSSQPVKGKEKDPRGPNHQHYYSDLAPESRERIDILINTAFNLFQGATFDLQSPGPSASDVNKTDPHIDSPLFVPIGSNDDLTPAYNERLSRLAQPCSTPRTSRNKHRLETPQVVRSGQTTSQSLTLAPPVPPNKLKRKADDVQGRETVCSGPFLDESTDEECRTLVTWGSENVKTTTK
ncbi:hypothetical protein AJ78_03562 [Emergomyces pasteurianus Ep9510]|uniref:Uncharacterized protein n=1 Tax=Emergomyces pasteurianus Ep9510 TaxID=1447872 RepID=A0A1J9QJB0_9EURO|nr:hypothetical protein AJ78_03562 [Emergomyces pasteurianus Ep9510]